MLTCLCAEHHGSIHNHRKTAQKVHEFYETLVYNVQSFETLGKLREFSGYVRTSLDKLEGIKGDQVGNENNLQEWDFQS